MVAQWASMAAGDMAGMAAWTLTGGRSTNRWLRPRQAAGRRLISPEKGLEMRSHSHLTVTRRLNLPAWISSNPLISLARPEGLEPPTF